LGSGVRIPSPAPIKKPVIYQQYSDASAAYRPLKRCAATGTKQHEETRIGTKSRPNAEHQLGILHKSDTETGAEFADRSGVKARRWDGATDVCRTLSIVTAAAGRSAHRAAVRWGVHKESNLGPAD
jgi:hypothetical protein